VPPAQAPRARTPSQVLRSLPRHCLGRIQRASRPGRPTTCPSTKRLLRVNFRPWAPCHPSGPGHDPGHTRFGALSPRRLSPERLSPERLSPGRLSPGRSRAPAQERPLSAVSTAIALGALLATGVQARSSSTGPHERLRAGTGRTSGEHLSPRLLRRSPGPEAHAGASSSASAAERAAGCPPTSTPHADSWPTGKVPTERRGGRRLLSAPPGPRPTYALSAWNIHACFSRSAVTWIRTS
jgi:hypothetical protein